MQCRAQRTSQVGVLAIARLVFGRFDFLLELFVVDIRARPFGDLVAREILAELHDCELRKGKATSAS